MIPINVLDLNFPSSRTKAEKRLRFIVSKIHMNRLNSCEQSMRGSIPVGMDFPGHLQANISPSSLRLSERVNMS